MIIGEIHPRCHRLQETVSMRGIVSPAVLMAATATSFLRGISGQQVSTVPATGTTRLVAYSEIRLQH
jgi:hypothetical protein